MERKQFGEFLKRVREAKGLTKTELAKRSGFTLRAVQYWEQGRKNITLENATRLLDALGMELVISAKGGETHGGGQAEDIPQQKANVTGDSGTAMIRDIMKNLGC